MKLPFPHSASGFTLIELAIAMLIIGLLVGGLLAPLAAQIEQRKLTETQKALQEIKEALVGFAVTNGRLPCPDYDTDPTAAGYGVEDISCSAVPATEGYLPWKTLGVSDLDGWGTKRIAATSPRIGDWRYRVDRNYVTTTGFKSFALMPAPPSPFLDDLRVQDRAGNDLAAAQERAIAIVFSAGKDTSANLANALFDQIYTSDTPDNLVPSDPGHFDDVVAWLSRPLIVNRMVAAGRLP